MRAEYIKCVRVAHEYAKEWTWCHKRAEGFVLTGIDHAAMLSVTGSRLTVCPECTESISMALHLMPLPWLEDLARGDDPRSPEEAARIEAECLGTADAMANERDKKYPSRTALYPCEFCEEPCLRCGFVDNKLACKKCFCGVVTGI